MKWVIYPAHASPSSSPSYSPFTYYFVIVGISLSQPVFLNRSCYTDYRSSPMFSIVRGQSKSEGPGTEPLGVSQGAKPPEADTFQGLKS